MTNGQKVGFGEGTLKSTSQLIAEAKVELRKQSADLQNKIDALQGQWGGDGAMAFAALNQAWDEKQGIIVMKLEQFEATLDETEKSLLATDSTSAAEVSKIAAQMER